MATLTHLAKFRSMRDGRSWLDQVPVGEPLSGVVDDLFSYGDRFVLEAVYALDLAAGTLTDVTAAALHALAEAVEAGEGDLPDGALDAFATYDVPLPQPQAAWSDAEAEHRLTSTDLGLSYGRAA